MKAKILLRRGTAQEWAQKNPVLGLGELGLETDTNKIKFGNGKSPWNSLPYETSDASASTNQDFIFSNSNGVSFGTNGTVVTASVQTNYQSAGAYLTTAMQSGAATSVGFAVPGSSVVANAIVFSNNGNVTFGLNGNTISASAPAAAGGGSVNFSAGATSNNLSAITFNNGSGVTFGLTGSTLTASVKTDYQTSGAYLTTAMQSNAATISNIKVSAGLSSSNVSAMTFSNGSGVSWGYDGTNITATVATNYQSQGAYLTTAALSQDSSKYAGINGAITGGSITVNTSGVSVNLPAYLTTADLSQNSSKYAGINSGATNCSVTVNTSGVSVALPNYLTTAALSQDSSKYAGINGAITGGSITVNTSGVSVNLPAYLTTADLSQNSSKYAGINSGATNCSVTVNTSGVSVSVGSYITTGALSSQTIVFSLGGNSATTNSSQISNGGYVLAGGNSLTIQQSNNTISFSVGNYITTADLSQNSSKYAGINGAITGGSITVNTSGVSVNLPAYLTTAMASNRGSDFVQATAAFAGTNASGTIASNGISVSVAAPGAAAENNWVTLLGANVSGNSSASGSTLGLSGLNITLSGTNNSQIIFSAPATSSLVGNNGISLSSNGSTISIQQVFQSSYENIPVLYSAATMTLAPGSVSHAVAFYLPEPVSASFIRIPVVMTTNSTTLSTLASSMNGSASIGTTWNAVIYSLGTGASSKSLQSVASGSCSWQIIQSISVAANGTQYSISQSLTGAAEGGATNRSTQYSISNSNYSFTTNQLLTEWSGSRFIDINFANSLSAGPYWLIFGLSTTSASNSARCSAATNCNVGYSNHYGNSQLNIAFGVMGSTNFTSGGLMGAGSFSTAGGGTTNSLPISAITSSSSHVRPYFQMLRSA